MCELKRWNFLVKRNSVYNWTGIMVRTWLLLKRMSYFSFYKMEVNNIKFTFWRKLNQLSSDKTLFQYHCCLVILAFCLLIWGLAQILLDPWCGNVRKELRTISVSLFFRMQSSEPPLPEEPFQLPHRCCSETPYSRRLVGLFFSLHLGLE